MIKISILHPTFERPQMSYKAFREWSSNASHPNEIEYLLGLDESDRRIREYEEVFSKEKNESSVGRFLLNIGPSSCAVQALNRIATMISPTSELIVEVLDDVSCFKGWDDALFKLLENVNNFEEPKMICTHDGLRDYGVVFTQPIMNRACYNKFGYVIYPEYTSMFADNDFTEVARRTGFIINAPHIMFKHNHYTIGGNPIDSTYQRRNNQEEFNKNHLIYQQRHSRNFDL